jgi:hypothetical protein
MHPSAVRTPLISVAALSAALVWGVVEFVALQWSRLVEQFR